MQWFAYHNEILSFGYCRRSKQPKKVANVCSLFLPRIGIRTVGCNVIISLDPGSAGLDTSSCSSMFQERFDVESSETEDPCAVPFPKICWIRRTSNIVRINNFVTEFCCRGMVTLFPSSMNIYDECFQQKLWPPATGCQSFCTSLCRLFVIWAILEQALRSRYFSASAMKNAHKRALFLGDFLPITKRGRSSPGSREVWQSCTNVDVLRQSHYSHRKDTAVNPPVYTVLTVCIHTARPNRTVTSLNAHRTTTVHTSSALVPLFG